MWCHVDLTTNIMYTVRGHPVQQATPDTITGIYLVIQLASGLC